jgi:DNA-binding transcriptional regulator of glucitol operon
MKFTKYFQFTKERPDRIDIKEEWIAKAFFSPIFEEIQNDGRIRRWAKISEADNKYLRIVILEDNETIHNAFFDRSFKEKI